MDASFSRREGYTGGGRVGKSLEGVHAVVRLQRAHEEVLGLVGVEPVDGGDGRRGAAPAAAAAAAPPRRLARVDGPSS